MSRLLILGVSPLPFEITDRSFGPGTRTWQITEPLLQDGHEVHLIGMRIPGTYANDAPDEIVHVDGRLTYLSITDRLYFQTPYVGNHCNEYSPDAVIFAHGSASYEPSLMAPDAPVWIDLCGHVMAEAQAKAAVYADDSYLDYFMHRIMGALYRGDRFSTVSEAQKYALIGELGLAGRLNARTNGLDLVHTIPCGVEESDYRHAGTAFREVELPREAFVVLWSGGFNTWTDIDTMFDGLVYAMDRNDALHLVATGGQIDGHDELTYPRFAEMIQSSPHHERFHLKGWLPRDQVPSYYFEADVGINCEKDIYEVRLGSKHRILDWSRAALPVVTTRVTELSEAIEREQVGFVTPPGDAEALGKTLLEAASRRVELPRIGHRFREVMRKLYGFRETTVALRQWAAAPLASPDRGAPRRCLEGLLAKTTPDDERAAETAPSERPAQTARPTEDFVDLTEGTPRRSVATRDTETDVRILGGELEYRDTSEERVLAILETASDRSTGSDELAAEISDWPTRYHLSRHRANLLRPFSIGPDARVLEIGAGTGAITRHLGEVGAQVIALEGSLARARAAALRCAGLDNVEVVCGPLDRFSDTDGFDLVVVVGVLEYASARAGGISDPVAFLESAAALVRPEGALILAIENQIGLKYLLGYSEDHLGEPWVGLEGYPGDSGIRTFTRRRLSAMLADVELASQRWYFPYPDYKLPKVILSEQAIQKELTPDGIDQLVGAPVRDLAHPRHRLCDDRRAHRVFLSEGLGTEVANSFLVVAARGDSAVQRFAGSETVAWHFGAERRLGWSRHQVVDSTGKGLAVRGFALARPGASSRRWWLEHRPDKEQPYFVGPTLEQVILDACHRWDEHAVEEALLLWSTHLDRLSFERPPDLGPAHPFLAHGDDRLLPPQLLDVILSNFVVVGDRLELVDEEWVVDHGVSPSLVMTRALWYLARDLISSGSSHPWPDDITVEELTGTLGGFCGLSIDGPLLESLYRAEAAFQSLVFGGDPAELEEEHARLGGLARTHPELRRLLPHSTLQRRLDQLETLRSSLEASRRWDENLRSGLFTLSQEMRALVAERDRLFAKSDQLIAEREGLSAENQRSAEERQSLASERDQIAAENRDLADRLRSVDAHLNGLLQWRQGFEQRWLVRLYHKLRGPRPWDVTGGGSPP